LTGARLLSYLCSRRVCDCELGFGAAAAARKGGGGGLRAEAWADAFEGFLSDPCLLRPEGADAAAAVDAGGTATVQVEVPPVEQLPEEGEDEARRGAAQRGAAAAEDLARRLEAGRFGSPVSGSFSLCTSGSLLTRSWVGVLARVHAEFLAVEGEFPSSEFVLSRLWLFGMNSAAVSVDVGERLRFCHGFVGILGLHGQEPWSGVESCILWSPGS
jgi:hypothetical protein